jgi:glycosyltransferase involved in cell wall biosynthesis
MSSTANRPVFALTWEDHRRMRELCGWLGVELRVLTTPHRGLRRYIALTWETLRLLRRARPTTVFIQNPSLILATVVIAARPFLGRYRIIMDAHNEAIEPFTYATWPIIWLTKRALRKADVTVVTNAALAATVHEQGGTALILPDRLPSAPIEPRPLPMLDTVSVMVVATYAADEPIAEILDAARKLGEPFRFSFTGNPAKLAAALRDGATANVRFTGFLPEHDYWQLMADSHVVLDLTLKPNCLVCGAYEALALQKPMVLTGNPATRDLFGRVALFPASDRSAAIEQTLRELRARYDELLDRLASEVPLFTERWDAAANALRNALRGPPDGA